MLTGQVKFGNINELSRQSVLRKDEKKSKKDVDKRSDERYNEKARKERAGLRKIGNRKGEEH